MNYNRFIISILVLLWNEAVLAEVESTQSRKLSKWGSMENLLHPKESSSSGSSTGDSSTSDSSSGRSWSYTGNSAGGGDENGAAAVRSGVANFPWMLIGVAAVATVGGVYAHKSGKFGVTKEESNDYKLSDEVVEMEATAAVVVDTKCGRCCRQNVTPVTNDGLNLA